MSILTHKQISLAETYLIPMLHKSSL